MNRPRLTLFAATALAAATLAACGSKSLTRSAAPPAPEAPSALARVMPLGTNSANGIVRFVPRGAELEVIGQISGLKPYGEHGLHVHERGDCSAPDGASAGGHFNPTGAAHGQPGVGAHHAGDLPSIKADAYGVANFRFRTAALTLVGARGVTDRSVVVHAGPDDYKSQPAGNSGARIGCGVVNAIP